MAWTLQAGGSPLLPPISLTLVGDFQPVPVLETPKTSQATEESPAPAESESRDAPAAAQNIEPPSSEDPEPNKPSVVRPHPPQEPEPVEMDPSQTAQDRDNIPTSSLSVIEAITESDRSARFAERTRVGRLVESDSLGGAERFYLDAWVRKVTRIGKMNYPREAIAENLHGRLRILAVVEADGSLLDVRVYESSGHAVLDNAALRIVRLAAPYAPFPPVLRRQFDRLEIIRGWEFRDRGAAPDA